MSDPVSQPKTTLARLLVEDSWTQTAHGDVRTKPRKATVSDLVDALRQLGAEEAESYWSAFTDLPIIQVSREGPFLVFDLSNLEEQP